MRRKRHQDDEPGYGVTVEEPAGPSPRQPVLDQLDKLNDDAWKSLIELLKKHGFPWR